MTVTCNGGSFFYKLFHGSLQFVEIAPHMREIQKSISCSTNLAKTGIFYND